MTRCLGRPSSPQVASLIRRIRSGKYPHYRAAVKNLRLSEPRGLSQSERDLLERRLHPAQPLHVCAEAAAQAPGGVNFAAREDVLRAFGLLECELPHVRAVGEASRRGTEGVESSDSEGELF